ncbi:hypothetical protein C9J85_02220 [Haloferax sp. wsp5]|nr:hypothetical protein C9J85_02220 [Haloferax sp. wsp5]
MKIEKERLRLGFEVDRHASRRRSQQWRRVFQRDGRQPGEWLRMYQRYEARVVAPARRVVDEASH